MIEVNHLTKVYGDHAAVKDLSFKLTNGRIYGLLGPNGAGKSTTMNMMTGCLAPTTGYVKINGFDVFEDPIEAKRFIGYLPELPPLYPDMTPEEYLTFVAEAKGVSPARVRRQVDEVMELLQITDKKDRLIKHLSKGYCQRVGIAQAMLGNPEIIILDEPTVGLDPKQITDIREIIRTLGENRTVIISSHILSEIDELCDELLVIAEGALVAQGTAEELQAMLGGTETLCLTVRGDEAGVCEVLDTIEGTGERTVEAAEEPGCVVVRLQVAHAGELRDTLFFAMAEHRYAVLEMEVEHKTLENVFLALTQTPEQPTEAEATSEAPDDVSAAQAEDETTDAPCEDESQQEADEQAKEEEA